MHLFYIIALTATVISNTSLIFILIRRAERAIMFASFVIGLLLINIWAIPQLVINIWHPKGDLFIAIDKISALGYTCIPVAFFVYALSFTDRLYIWTKKIIFFLVFFLPFVFLYLAWNTNLIESRNYLLVKPSSWGYIVPTGELFPIFLIWFEGIIFATLYFIFHFYRHTLDVIKKKQAVFLMIALLIPTVFGTITNGILPAIQIHVFPMAIPLTSIMALTIAYAIFRYELFELSPLTILSSIGSGVITVNNYREIVHINTAAQQLLKIQKNAIIGRKFQDVIQLKKFKSDLKKVNDLYPLDFVMNTGETIETSDLVMANKLRKKFPVECTVSPIFLDKKIVGATFVFRDITKEKELEANKNEFISIASHELKTPITAIKAFSELLEKKLEKSTDKQAVYFIKIINEQIGKIMDLINDLLNANRIEEGRFVISKKKSNVYDLVKKVVYDLQYTTETHKIVLSGTAKKEIMVDEERIQQVLINLISNAIKYSPNANKIVVNISSKMNQITISVQDFGIGIPDKDRKNIFKRFYRSSLSDGKTIAGFGLGLYICSEIIRQHKGKIWVKSKKGKGSTFFFTLPE